MISRRTTRLLAQIFDLSFRGHYYSGRSDYFALKDSEVYDFLFDNGYAAWFCNEARRVASYCQRSTRPFTDFVLKVHTGESIASATKDWTWPQREKLGQQLLRDLAKDIAKHFKISRNPSSTQDILSELNRSLELDGYVFRGDVLLATEEDVLDVKEESGVLQELYLELQLLNQDTVFHHLTLSEEHYLAKRWDDSISNSRKFLEGVLQEIAASHHLAFRKTEINAETYSRPARVREYLELSELLTTKEKSALSSLYGLLSETGGHPYMAESEQARLLRHLALTFSQFALLRLRGFKTTGPK